MLRSERPTQAESKSASRRAILAAALGGAAAMVARTVARPSPVRAAGDDGTAIAIGGTYGDVQSQTTLGNKANNEIVLWVASNTDLGHGGGNAIVGVSGSGTGVWGTCPNGTGVEATSTQGTAMHATSDTGTAIAGSSNSGVGVLGASDLSAAVEGVSEATGAAAIVGYSGGNATGVFGHSGSSPVAVRPQTGGFGNAGQSTSSRGVWGESPAGIGVYGRTTTGYAGYFQGKVFTSSYHEMIEITTPAAPGANRARQFVRDNGAGKTQLCVRFATGSVKLLAQEA
jgi:hypothetical protein